MRRSLIAGLVLAVFAALIIGLGELFGLDLQPVALLGAALGGVLGLVPHRFPLGKLGGFVLGFVIAWIGYALRAAVLPDAPGGRAVAVLVVVALVAVACAISADRVPLWSALLGAAAIAGAYEEIYTNAPSQFLKESPTAATAVLLAAALGYLATTLVVEGQRAVAADGAGTQHERRARHASADTQRNLRQPPDRRPQVISKKTAVRAGASFFAVPAAMVMAAGPSLAAGSDVIVTNTETVQAYLSATGRLDVARVYDQLALKGKGKVSVSNPVETKGLRNLDSFGGFEVKDGNVVGTYEVDGEQRLRTVSDFTKSLPLDVHVSYTLDGKEVKPGDVVGKSGLLKVQYTVRNVTGKPQEVSFDDGTGKTVTATEDVVIPMVGSLSTVLPPNFTDVRSGEANMAGDGRGGTKMSFTMTLFGPIGKPEATFGYEAQISDGVIPKASISALPVSPLDSPSFKGGAESYKGGAETGATLTAGASEIDANLLKLRDGAGDLLAGLIQLRDGANQLNAGLSGEAAPGAKKLADGANQASAGAGELSSGVGQLDDGAKKLSAGSKELAGGTGQLADGAASAKAGSGKVADGAGQVADGSAMLADGLAADPLGVNALPDNPDVQDGTDQLKAALDAVIAGIGDAKTAETLLWGIAQMQGGVGQLRLGLDHETGAGGETDPGGVKQVLQRLIERPGQPRPCKPRGQAVLKSDPGRVSANVPTSPTDTAVPSRP